MTQQAPDWNPDTRLVWSSAGSQKEIPAAEYDNYISQGWGASAPPPQETPADIPPVSSTDILSSGEDSYFDELTGAEADYYKTLTPEYRQESREQSDADIMKKFQAEIDTLERERIEARGRLEGQYADISKGRQGTISASAARRGLAGSTFAEEQSKTTRSATLREKDAAMAYSSAQYAERKKAVMGDVRTAQSDEAKLRLESAQLGSQAKIEEIRGRKTRADERVSTAIQNLLGMKADVEDEELMAEVAEGLGISVKDLQSRYESIKSEAEEAQRVLNEEQLDREMKRNLTQSQIDKIENDRKDIDRKFEQDKIEFGADYAMKEQELALDVWKAEQKQALDEYKATEPKSYAPSSQRKLYSELGGEAGTGLSFNEWYEQKSGGIVEWSEENEAAGVVGWTQKKLDWVMDSPTAPPEFSQMMSEEHQMSKDWQEEWDEERNTILDAYRKKEPSGFSGQQKLDLETRYGADWEETVPRSQQLNYLKSLKKSSGRTY